MRIVRNTILIALIAVFTAPAANAQLGGLLNRAKDRAEDALEERAGEEVDKGVDAVVGELWDAAAARFGNMMKGLAGDSKTTVDLDAGVIHRAGASDIVIEENDAVPLDATHVRWMEVTMVEYPKGQEMLVDYFGNGNVREILLHGSRKMVKEIDGGEITDAAEGMLYSYDDKEQEYWTLDYNWMLNNAEESFGKLNQVMEQAEAENGDGQTMEDGLVTMEYNSSLETRLGERREHRGVMAQQHILILTMVPADPEMARQQGTMHNITVLWMAEDYGGVESIEAYDAIMGETMMDAIHSSGIDGANLSFTAFGDPRMEDAQVEAADYQYSLAGTPIEQIGYYVKGPFGQPLDFNAVMNGEGETDPRVYSTATEGEGVQTQSTMLTTRQFMTNLKTATFDESEIGVPAGYTEVESPMKAFLDGDYDAQLQEAIDEGND